MSGRRGGSRRGIGVAALALALAGPVRAESLFDAIHLAYETNPALRAQRAQLRATDETYVQARAGFGPTVSLSAQGGHEAATVDQPQSIFSAASSPSYHADTGQVDLSIVQPLYTSGATGAATRGAAAGVQAGREGLRQSEAQLIQNVVTAYLDVRRDRASLAVLREEIVALQTEFKETQAKGKAGQLTRTDVAESESRLLSAQAQLNLAQGRLNTSNAEYLNAVGQSPGELEPEPDLPGMPTKVDDAFEIADRANPQLLAAVNNERSAREAVNQARAANGPTVSVRVDAAVVPNAPYFTHQYDRSVSVAAVYNQPLFTSGLNSSRIREALAKDNQAQLDVENARRGVVQLVSQAWSTLAATRGAIDIEQRQIEIQTVAVQGNRVEEKVGLRSTIDLLNAELELANARLNLLQSQHDEYLARVGLLSAMGLLEVRFLTPGTALYDPAASFNKVKSIGAAPWEGAVEQLDTLHTPYPKPHPVSPTDAGAEHPTDLPPLPGPH